MLFVSCFNSSNQDSNDVYPEELREVASQYNIIENIDTVNLVSLNAKVFQVLDENTCLAQEISSEEYNWYLGNIIQVLTNDLLFDEKIIDGDYVLLGTYHYQSADSVPRTVKLYSDIDYFRNNKTYIEKIREINKGQ